MAFLEIAKTQQADSSDVSSFEKTYKSSYSHGLEKIYALENIDIRSVRKIIDAPVQTIVETKEENHWRPDSQDQLEFSFGAELHGGEITSFVLREPIQVLGLPKNVEKCLIGQQKLLLKDLLEDDLQTLSTLRGLGQGHIDDLQDKLKSYLSGKPIHKSTKIYFSSWLRTLIANAEPKKTFVGLESYNLSEFVSLSPAENMEVRRLSPDIRKQWAQECLDNFRTEPRCKQVKEDVEHIINAFIKPWMKNRCGLATEAELSERLLFKSDSEEDAQRIMPWLQSVYFSNQFPLTKSLFSIDEKLFAVDAEAAQNYDEVIEKARTYFYNPDVRYSLDLLVNMILCEFAKGWNHFSEDFIKKVLRISPQFRVRKAESGQLLITIS